jgi:dipeptidyl-peptidase-3
MKVAEQYCDSEPPVQRLDIREAFEQLSTEEKCYAHYMREAAFHGSRIIMRQVSPESETIFNLILHLWRVCEGDWVCLAEKAGVDGETMSKFLDYSATAMENLGNYKGYGDQKFIPRISSEDLEKICSVSQDAVDLLRLSQQFIFETTPKALGFPNEGGMSNYYPESPHITKEEIRAVGDATCSKISLRNTRLQTVLTESGFVYQLLVASVIEHPAKHELQDLVLPDGSKIIVKYGDHSDVLSRICDSLAKAKEFAASKEQETYLSKLISFYQTGDIETHKEASKDWLADDSPCVETWSGFLEPGRDPIGVRCEFEALVAVQDKRWSAAFDQLSSRAEQFILQLPWSGLGPDAKELGPFENEVIAKANFVALNCKCQSMSN